MYCGLMRRGCRGGGFRPVSGLAAAVSGTTWTGRRRQARARLVEAAAAAGIPAIDAPCFALKDPDAIARESREARSFGFAGKLAIHPAQIALLNESFSPSPEEVAWARRVLDENTKGAGSVDGLLVDEAVARRARSILGSA
jgi:(S)-citramalyl-CoA lyase